MENVLRVAKVFYDYFFEENGYNVDELKMHKLMYLAQRESLIEYDEPLFFAHFYGWKFGPVLKEIREEYRTGNLFKDISLPTEPKTLELVRSVLKRYGDMSSWDLSNLSHQELSWKMARKGLEPGDNGNKELSIDMIKVDAIREKLTREHYGL